MAKMRPWWETATADQTRALAAANWRRSMDVGVFRSQRPDVPGTTADILAATSRAIAANPLDTRPKDPPPTGPVGSPGPVEPDPAQDDESEIRRLLAKIGGAVGGAGGRARDLLVGTAEQRARFGDPANQADPNASGLFKRTRPGGFDLSGAGGPFSLNLGSTGSFAPEGSNVVVEEALRPINYVPGLNIARGLSFAPKAGAATRIAAEIAAAAGFGKASEEVGERLPEDMNPYLRGGIQVGAGLVAGGGAGIAAARVPGAARAINAAGDAAALRAVPGAGEFGRGVRQDAAFPRQPIKGAADDTLVTPFGTSDQLPPGSAAALNRIITREIEALPRTPTGALQLQAADRAKMEELGQLMAMQRLADALEQVDQPIDALTILQRHFEESGRLIEDMNVPKGGMGRNPAPLFGSPERTAFDDARRSARAAGLGGGQQRGGSGRPRQTSDVPNPVLASYNEALGRILDEASIGTLDDADLIARFAELRGRVGATAPEPTLPSGLAGARPRYRENAVTFESDVDKAAYIVSAPTKSKQHDAYLGFLENAGLGPDEIAERYDAVRAVLRSGVADENGVLTVSDTRTAATMNPVQGGLEGIALDKPTFVPENAAPMAQGEMPIGSGARSVETAGPMFAGVSRETLPPSDRLVAGGMADVVPSEVPAGAAKDYPLRPPATAPTIPMPVSNRVPLWRDPDALARAQANAEPPSVVETGVPAWGAADPPGGTPPAPPGGPGLPSGRIPGGPGGRPAHPYKPAEQPYSILERNYIAPEEDLSAFRDPFAPDARGMRTREPDFSDTSSVHRAAQLYGVDGRDAPVGILDALVRAEAFVQPGGVKLPKAIKNIRGVANPAANDMPPHIWQAYNGGANATADVAARALPSQIELVRDFNRIFPEVATGPIRRAAAHVSAGSLAGDIGQRQVRYKGPQTMLRTFREDGKLVVREIHIDDWRDVRGGRVIGTAKDIIDRPGMYDLTPEEIQFIADLNRRNLDLNEIIRSHYDVEIGNFGVQPWFLDQGNFGFLPTVNKGEDALAAASRTARGATGSGRTQERVFASAAERAAEDPDFVPETDFHVLLNGLDQAKARLAGRQTFAAGVGGSRTPRVDLTDTGFGTYVPAEEAKYLARLARTLDPKSVEGRIVHAANSLNAGALSADFSPFTIQGVMGMLGHPVTVAQSVVGGVKRAVGAGDVRTLWNEASLVKKMREDPQGWLDFAAATGRNIPAGTPEEFAGGWLQGIPGYSAFNRSTYSMLTSLQKDIFTSTRARWIGRGKSAVEANAIAGDHAAQAIPFLNPARKGLSPAGAQESRVPFVSVAFARKPLEVASEAVQGAANLMLRRPVTPAQQESLEFGTRIIGMLSAASASSAAANAIAEGLDPFEAVGDVLNPDSPNALRVYAPGTGWSVALGGPYRALYQAFAPRPVDTGFTMPWGGSTVYLPGVGIEKYFGDRVQILGKRTYEALRNKDYYGQPIETATNRALALMQGLIYIGEGTIPLAAGTPLEAERRGLETAEAAVQTGIAFAGVSGRGPNTRDLRNAATQKLGLGKSYDELNTGQRRQVDETPEVKAMLERREPPVVATRDQVNFALTGLRERYAGIEARARSAIDAGADGPVLREAVSDLKASRYEASQALFTQAVQAGLKVKDNPAIEDVFAEQYWSVAAIEDPRTGRVDFATRDAARADILAEAKKAGIDTKYITGNQPGAFRGTRFVDPVVRQAVIEQEDLQDRLQETGYFTISDQAWRTAIGTLSDGPLKTQVSQYPDAGAYLDARTDEMVDRIGRNLPGINADALRERAALLVRNDPLAQRFDAIKQRERLKWARVHQQDGLAGQAIKYGYLSASGANTGAASTPAAPPAAPQPVPTRAPLTPFPRIGGGAVGAAAGALAGLPVLGR